MRDQVTRFNLEPLGCTLGVLKSLVMLMLTAVNEDAADGGKPLLRVGQWLRERVTGAYFCVSALYNPLLGFSVDGKLDVHMDEKSEPHTLLVAKSSRILGGNSGYFNGDDDGLLVALNNVRFANVWMSVRASAIDAAFDVSEPSESDLKKAIGDNYKEFPDRSQEGWASVSHAQADKDSGFAGGIVIAEESLKLTSHLTYQCKKRRAKPYLAEAEQAEAARVRQAAVAAARAAKNEKPMPNVPSDNRRSKRARAPRVNFDAGNGEEQGAPADVTKSKHVPAAKDARRGGPPAPSSPKQQPETERKEATINDKPPPTTTTPINISPASPIRRAPSGCKSDHSSVLQSVPDDSKVWASTAPPTCVDTPSQQQPIKKAQHNNLPQQTPQQQQLERNGMHAPGADATINSSRPSFFLPQPTYQHSQQPNMATMANMAGVQPMGGFYFSQQAIPGGQALHVNNILPQQFAYMPHGQMYPAAMQMQMPGMPAPALNNMYYGALPPQGMPTTGAAGNKQPSLSAIRARLIFESRKTEDLLESQAVSEYYTELYGLPP